MLRFLAQKYSVIWLKLIHLLSIKVSVIPSFKIFQYILLSPQSVIIVHSVKRDCTPILCQPYAQHRDTAVKKKEKENSVFMELTFSPRVRKALRSSLM